MLSMMSSIRLRRKSQRNALREVTIMRYSAVKKLGVVIAELAETTELADATALTLIVVTSKITTATVVVGVVVAEAVTAAEVIVADAALAVVVNQLL